MLTISSELIKFNNIITFNCYGFTPLYIHVGGFSVVFRVKSSRGRRLALKRMAVNNDNDLYLARQEIAIMVRHV